MKAMTLDEQIREHERTLRLYGCEGLMTTAQVRSVEAQLVGLRILRAAEGAIALLVEQGVDVTEMRTQASDLRRVIDRAAREQNA